MNSMDELIKLIAYLDTNEQAYMWMLEQYPIKYKMPVYDTHAFNFLNWFESVVYEKKYMRAL
jgi:hypothetical protein